jgi:hypothetical protein
MPRSDVRIFLLWRRDRGPGEALEPAAVGRRLAALFAPLLAAEPVIAVEERRAAAMVFAHLPVAGWRTPFVQHDAAGRAYAIDYPIGAARVLAAAGMPVAPGEPELPALGRRLEEDPAPLLRELPPPFSLVWWPAGGEEALVQTDGLGRSQVLEYDDGALWAATNKVTALRALGVEPEPDATDWAVKCAGGWFTMDSTGYRHLRYLAPGTQLRVTPEGVRRRADDVLDEWVHPPALAPEDALELGRVALIRHVRDGEAHLERADVGLTGGWDTRAVVSSYLAAGVGVRAYVKGREGSIDVAIAKRLAEIAGIELEVREEADLPADDPGGLERSLRLAMLWQAGMMWSEHHKSFLADGRPLDGGVVTVMGQYGEIARGSYERRIRAWEAAGPHEYEDRLIARMTKERPPGMRPEALTRARDVMRESYRRLARHGIEGAAMLDLFHLAERERRYNGASLSSHPGVAFTPFLTPDLIRASYAYRAAGGTFVARKRTVNPIHRHAIAANVPTWRDVEDEDEVFRVARRAARAEGRRVGAAEGPAWHSGGGPPRGYYDRERYWREVAGPVARGVLSRDGVWTEVFDAAALRAAAEPAPVEALMVALAEEVVGGRSAPGVVRSP